MTDEELAKGFDSRKLPHAHSIKAMGCKSKECLATHVVLFDEDGTPFAVMIVDASVFATIATGLDAVLTEKLNDRPTLLS